MTTSLNDLVTEAEKILGSSPGLSWVEAVQTAARELNYPSPARIAQTALQMTSANPKMTWQQAVTSGQVQVASTIQDANSTIPTTQKVLTTGYAQPGVGGSQWHPAAPTITNGKEDYLDAQVRKLMEASVDPNTGQSLISAADARNSILQHSGASQAQGPNGGSTSALIYWGANKGGVKYQNLGPGQSNVSRGERPITPVPDQAIYKTEDEAMYWLQNEYNSQTPEWKKVKDLLVGAGYAKSGDTVMQILNAWAGYIHNRAMPSSANGSTLTPEQMLAQEAGQNQKAQATTQHLTTTTTNRMSVADAGASAQRVAQSALGRRLSASEQAAQGKVAQGVAAANPTISHETRTTNAAGTATTSTISQSGGVTQSAIDEALLQQTMQNPEYGAYQAAGYYFPILQQALGGVTSAGT